MQRLPDPYQALGVDHDASMAEIKASHRRLAKRYHPDAPHADPARFLAVQDAYELLRDPLRRGEWDRRHAPGPVRAEPSTGVGRRRGSPSTDRPATTAAPGTPRGRRRRPAGVDTTFGPNDRPPDADSWTWTAAGVPWWEDGGSPRARRSSRRRAAGDGDEARSGDAEPSGAASPASGARRGRPPGTDPEPPRARAPNESGAPEMRNETDVFSRSSGAAWSSASRAYFRRRAADMPSGAANPDTPRWTTPVGAPPPRRYAAGPTAPIGADPSEPVTRGGPVAAAGPAAAAAAGPATAAAAGPATPAGPSAAAGPATPAGPSAAAGPATPAGAAAAGLKPMRRGRPGSSRRLSAALAALFRRGAP